MAGTLVGGDIAVIVSYFVIVIGVGIWVKSGPCCSLIGWRCMASASSDRFMGFLHRPFRRNVEHVISIRECVIFKESSETCKEESHCLLRLHNLIFF